MKVAGELCTPKGITDGSTSHSKRKFIIRDDKPICFGPCNNAENQAAKIGRQPLLCALDSSFEIDYRLCKDCIVTAWVSRGVNFNYTATEIFKLEPWLRYCVSTTAQGSLERVEASAEIKIVSLLSKFETSLPTTLPTQTPTNNLNMAATTSQRPTIGGILMIPTDSQSSPSPASTNQNHTQWTITGTGVALGTVILVIISSAAAFLLRRRKRYQLKEKPVLKQPNIDSQGGDKPQLHSESFIQFELPLSLRRFPELLGLQKSIPELPIHEKAELAAERSPLEVPAVEPVGLELPVEMTSAKL